MIPRDFILGRITAPHFVAGLIVEDDRVVRTAPILKYMMGWTPLQVGDYVSKKGWAIEALGPADV